MLDQFQSYLKSKGKSFNTIKNYTNDIKLFFNYFDKSPATLTKENIQSYKFYLQNIKQVDAKTINRVLSSLKSYNEFLISNNYQNSMVVEQDDYISIQKSFSSPTNITKEEVEKFISKVKENEPYRNYAIIVFIANTGLRISEALSIKLNDIKLNRKEATIIGKGNKQRDIILNKNAREVIKEYLINYRNRYLYASQSQYLFVSNKGEKLHPSTIERIFNKYSNKITPHSLRHLFATNVLENKVLDVRQLQEQLGHSRLETVLIYTHPSKDSMKKSLDLDVACIG